MSKKFNNLYLLIVFVALILLFVFVKFFQSVRTEKTLKVEIVQIDTTKVNKILLYPASEKGQEVIFTKEGKEWKVSDGKISKETEKGALKNILTQLQGIRANRLVSRTKDKWAEYQVNDSLATRVKVFEGSKEKLNLYIGKFTYQQANDPYGRGGVIGTSYVRLADEKEIYAVDGFLTFSFNLGFNKWRNQSFINYNKADITKLTFRYPGDSSFVAQLVDKKWMVNGQPVDSTTLVGYISSLSNKKASTFNDSFSPFGNAQYQLTVEGNNMNTLTVDAFDNGNSNYVINSSLNQKSWFDSDRKGIFSDIFKSKKYFINPKGNKGKK
jgi:hypothetical protein